MFKLSNLKSFEYFIWILSFAVAVQLSASILTLSEQSIVLGLLAFMFVSFGLITKKVLSELWQPIAFILNLSAYFLFVVLLSKVGVKFPELFFLLFCFTFLMSFVIGSRLLIAFTPFTLALFSPFSLPIGVLFGSFEKVLSNDIVATIYIVCFLVVLLLERKVNSKLLSCFSNALFIALNFLVIGATVSNGFTGSLFGARGLIIFAIWFPLLMPICFYAYKTRKLFIFSSSILFMVLILGLFFLLFLYDLNFGLLFLAMSVLLMLVVLLLTKYYMNENYVENLNASKD